MAGLLDIFGGGGGLYGDLLNDDQKSALATRGLLAMAGAFAQAAKPSLGVPGPGLGATIGAAAAALGGSQDEAATAAINAMLRGTQAADLKSKARSRDLLNQILEAAKTGGTGGGAAPQGTASLPSIQGPLAAPGAGGGAGAPAGGVPAKGLGGLLLPEIKSTDLGGDDSGIEYPATDPSGLKAGGALLRPQAAATPALSADLAHYQTGGLLAPQPAELPQLASYAVGNAVPGGASPITGVAPGMSNRLEAMLAGMPPDVLQKFNVLSGYRSPERQAQVNPGVTNSRHTAGTAVDTTTDPAVLDWVRQNGPQYGVGYTLAGMPGEENHLEMLGAGGGRAPIQTAALQTGGLTGSAREIADNNFGGMRRPGVIATPGQGGFQAFATPAEGLAAISRQLDRYASGATTGKPLTTIRQIVSTWAPPNENPTEALIARASKIVGVDPDTPLDVSNPAVKAKLIEATIRNEQGGRLPVDPGLIEQAANASPGTVTGGPDTVVPTGDRPSLPVQRTQYAPAPGGLLAAPAAPAGPGLLTPQGKIPGFNLTPAEAARADALADIAGLGRPFQSILETYYKSPEYLRDAAGAAEAGKLPYVGPTETARQTAAEPFKIREQQRALENKLIEDGWRIENGQAIPIPNYNTVREAKERSISLGQTGPKLEADLAKEGKQLLYDSAGKPVIVPLQGWSKTAAASAGEIKTAEQQAIADVAAGSAPGLAGRTEFAKGIATQDLEHRKAAESARDSLEGLDDARAMVNSGIFAGAGADWKLRLAKAGQVLGFDNERIANTESYIQLRAREVLNILGSRALGAGTGISSSDRDFATGVANGSIQLDERTIKRMLDIQEKVSTNAYNRWNRRADELEKAAPGTGARIEPPIRAGALPEGVPPGSVPGTPTIHGKPTWRTPNGKVLVVE